MNLPAHQKMLSAAAAASVLLLTAACGGGSDSDGASSSATTSVTTDAPSDTSTDATADSSGTAKDGTYEAEGSYVNPGGNSTVKVELTIADGKVSDVTVTPEATNGESKEYQTKFAGGIADEVVGKSLDDIKVSKVAGSSLTSQGFNKALDKIKSDAQA